MSPESVLSKTQKGAREIETRENRLDPKLRTLLIVINGRTTSGELAKKFAQIGDISPMLQQLVAQGYVSVAAPAADAAHELRQLKIALCMQLRDALGPDADALTAKVEAVGSAQDVRAWFAANRAMLDEWLGKSKAAKFWAKADPLLR